MYQIGNLLFTKTRRNMWFQRWLILQFSAKSVVNCSACNIYSVPVSFTSAPRPNRISTEKAPYASHVRLGVSPLSCRKFASIKPASHWISNTQHKYTLMCTWRTVRFSTDWSSMQSSIAFKNILQEIVIDNGENSIASGKGSKMRNINRIAS